MIREIDRQLPGKRYIVASLLDWRTKEDRTRYEEFAEELGIQIDSLSLISGEIQVTGQPYHEEEKSAINFRAQNDFSYEQRELKLDEVIAVISEDSFGMLNKSPYLNSTGRFGVSTSDYNESLSVAEVISKGLKSDRKGKKTLCLGTGEFMFFPMLLSSQMGEGVMYQSSTRSPIYPVNQENYAIKNRVVYPSPDDPSITNYLYNIPHRYYDEVYIFIEREVERKRLQPMINAVGSLGIPRIVVVTCT